MDSTDEVHMAFPHLMLDRFCEPISNVVGFTNLYHLIMAIPQLKTVGFSGGAWDIRRCILVVWGVETTVLEQ
jgi:hypothetical protein